MIEFEIPPIEIALSSDQNYFCGLLLTAVSVAKFARRECCLSFHILDGGICDNDFNFLVSKLKEAHHHILIDRIVISKIDHSHFPTFHGSRMTFARLLLPSLLPKVSYVLYLDVDLMVIGDVYELAQLYNPSFLAQGAIDKFQIPGIEETERMYCIDNGLAFDSSKYIKLVR